MSTEQNASLKEFKEALDNQSLKKAIKAVSQLDSESVYAVFASKLAQPGGFQVRADRAKRNKFFDSLLNDPVMDNHSDAQAYAKDLNEKIKIIEQGFDQIRDSLPKCSISDHPENVQFWSHVELAASELGELRAAGEKNLDKLKAKAKSKKPFIMPEMSIVTLPGGIKINLDTGYSAIVNMLSLTLKMLAFEHKLLVDDLLVAPMKPEIINEHLQKAGSVRDLAMAWNSLEDVGARTLFFGGQVGDLDSLKIPHDTFPADPSGRYLNPILYYRSPAYDEAYDFAANRRLHSWAVQNTFHLLQGTVLRNAIMLKGGKPPALTGGPFVSEDEAVTLTTLAEFLSFDVFSDQDRHQGLTLREWVRGYCALKLMAKAKAGKARTSLISFDREELKQGFIDYRIPEECVSVLINHLTFGKESRDLFDTPLICSQGDQYWLLSEILIVCNLVNVILSKLGSVNVQLDKKGKGFEDKVVSYLTDLGYPCKPTKFNYDGEQYEYDALMLVEDSLFLIECKNNLLSSNHAVQVLRYSKFIGDTVNQVKRLEHGLNARPEIVKSLFGRSLDELTIVPVILNSLPYSRAPMNGVYISDYSAFSKFLSESTISEHNWKNGKKQIRKVIHRLWEGEKPTVREFLEYLTLPFQVRLILEHLTYDAHPRFTSDSTMYWSAVLDVNETALQQAKQDAPSVD
ncbi:hypothetical protein PPUJ20005_38300 [Pseudomonas putida]|uniref:hypothetical protein n=1 Tax=Pseudomonas putida TaxID=303 RepID=UPI00235C257F|nr:hypothetical protein [Pseudomonas putida]GLO09861.1 hypothetical protein PPUJ20005_38300 [Pseudomonas putida]HDS0987052.1 hypothetical protein [Pseudomonas putida]